MTVYTAADAVSTLLSLPTPLPRIQCPLFVYAEWIKIPRIFHQPNLLSENANGLDFRLSDDISFYHYRAFVLVCGLWCTCEVYLTHSHFDTYHISFTFRLLYSIFAVAVNTIPIKSSLPVAADHRPHNSKISQHSRMFIVHHSPLARGQRGIINLHVFIVATRSL